MIERWPGAPHAPQLSGAEYTLAPDEDDR